MFATARLAATFVQPDEHIKFHQSFCTWTPSHTESRGASPQPNTMAVLKFVGQSFNPVAGGQDRATDFLVPFLSPQTVWPINRE
jgi:hypothetical protein